MQGEQFLAVVGKLENSFSSKEVDLECLTDRVVKVDARRRVDDDVKLVSELSAHFGVNAKTLKHQITLDGHNSLANDLKQFRPSLEERAENF